MNFQLIFISAIFLHILLHYNALHLQDGACLGSGVHCYCDELCFFNGDCCHNELPTTTTTKLASCHHHFYAIDKCIDRFTNENLRKNCETNFLQKVTINQLIFHVPVYGTFDDLPTVYKNAFCAVCNGITNYNYSKVEITTIVNVTSSINIELNVNDITFVVPDNFKRMCQLDVIKTCVKTSPFYSPIINKKCETEPTFYIVDKDSFVYTTYRNVYCYLCKSPVKSFLKRKFPLGTQALDYNQWCLSDCQALLESSKTNESVTRTNSTTYQCSYKIYIQTIEKVALVALRIVSLISLLFMLFVYNCIDDQQNRAGTITICLASSILLLTATNVIMDVPENPSKRFCFYSSLLHHYCFLSSFFWMSLFAIDVYQSITSSSVAKRENSTLTGSKRLKIYFIIGYVAPVMFTITSVTIQLANENNVLNPGFAERHCFINRLIGGLVWLFIPLCICLLINVVVCAGLYRFIYTANQQTALVRNSQKARKQSFMLCVKLSILFGAVWLPAFVGIFMDNFIMKFVGGIFSSFQGTSVSFCFIFGIKVRRKTYQYLRTITDSFIGFTIRKSENKCPQEELTGNVPLR